MCTCKIIHFREQKPTALGQACHGISEKLLPKRSSRAANQSFPSIEPRAFPVLHHRLPKPPPPQTPSWNRSIAVIVQLALIPEELQCHAKLARTCVCTRVACPFESRCCHCMQVGEGSWVKSFVNALSNVGRWSSGDRYIYGRSCSSLKGVEVLVLT